MPRLWWCCPQRSLFDQEVKALSDYLNQGGSLLLMYTIQSLLKIGVTLDNRLAIDPSGVVVLVLLSP